MKMASKKRTGIHNNHIHHVDIILGVTMFETSAWKPCTWSPGKPQAPPVTNISPVNAATTLEGQSSVPTWIGWPWNLTLIIGE